MDLLNMIPWGTVTPGGLLTIAVLLILRGDIVPRKTFEAVERERDTWRKTSEEKDATIRELTASATATAALLRALPQRPMTERDE